MSSHLHPEIEIIFLTFSNRIGVYRCCSYLNRVFSRHLAIGCGATRPRLSASNTSTSPVQLAAPRGTSFWMARRMLRLFAQPLLAALLSLQQPRSAHYSRLTMRRYSAIPVSRSGLAGHETESKHPPHFDRKNFQHALASLHDASPSASSSPGAICGPLVTWLSVMSLTLPRR
jgi:hypothetical protein